MISNVSCVVRSFNGNNELVRVEDAYNLVVGERVLTARMADYYIQSGPSGSHQVRVWSPREKFVESRYGIADESVVEFEVGEDVADKDILGAFFGSLGDSQAQPASVAA